MKKKKFILICLDKRTHWHWCLYSIDVFFFFILRCICEIFIVSNSRENISFNFGFSIFSCCLCLSFSFANIELKMKEKKRRRKGRMITRLIDEWRKKYINISFIFYFLLQFLFLIPEENNRIFFFLTDEIEKYLFFLLSLFVYNKINISCDWICPINCFIFVLFSFRILILIFFFSCHFIVVSIDIK